MFLAQIFSDVHQRFDKVSIHPDVQIILVLGDLGEGNDCANWLISLNKTVLYVPGNHEFYNYDITERIKELENKFKNSKVILLNDKVAQAKNVQFIGSTLWSDQFSLNPQMMKISSSMINDYKFIEVSKLLTNEEYLNEYNNMVEQFNNSVPKLKGFFSKKPKYLNPLLALLLHKKSVSFLHNQLAKPFNGSTVVMTHHAPLLSSLLFSGYAPIDENNQFLDFFNLKFRETKNASYASDLSFLIKEFKPNLWLHGHLHNGAHYAYEKTSIISNPIGYEDWQNPHFTQPFLIDLHNLVPIRHHMTLHTLLTSQQKQERAMQFLQQNILNNNDEYELSQRCSQQQFVTTYNLFIQPLLDLSKNDNLQVKNKPSLLKNTTETLNKKEFIQNIYSSIERNLEKTKDWTQSFNENFSNSLNEVSNPYKKYTPIQN